MKAKNERKIIIFKTFEYSNLIFIHKIVYVHPKSRKSFTTQFPRKLLTISLVNEDDSYFVVYKITNCIYYFNNHNLN